jgi:hypothetical protein
VEAVTDPDHRPAGGWSRWGGPLVMLLAAVSFGFVAVGALIPSDAERELAAFRPTAERPDPSVEIPGVVVEAVPAHAHDVPGAAPAVEPGQAPAGGSHGPAIARCDGVAHAEPVAAADAVHALEHSAVWITYDPAQTAPDTVRALSGRVSDGDNLLMSPVPGLAVPLSLQSWGHRLSLDTPEDPRFEQFIVALAGNTFLSPEPGAGCAPA